MANVDNQLKQKAKQQLAKGNLTALEKLRCRCLARGASGIKGLGRQFLIMDDNRSKSLDFQEFKKGCSDFGTGLTDEEIQSVFQEFDKDGTGTISFDEFLIGLRGPMSASRKATIEKAFKKMDKDGSGEINVKDLKGVYNVKNHPKYKNGEWTEEQCLREFLDSFEDPNQDPDGKVTFDEFLSYYAGVSSSIDDDAYFNLMIINAWKL